MRKHAYAIVTTLLTLAGVALLYYGHEQPALWIVLLLGCGWAVVSRGWLAWKGRLHPGLLRGLCGRENRAHLLEAVGRASFWAALASVCVVVFPRSGETAPLLAGLIGAGLLRVAACFLVPRRTNGGPAIVLAAGALLLGFELGRVLFGGPAPAVRIAPPVEGEWLVVQGGWSRLQNQHLFSYNQHFALDIVRLEGGRIGTGGTGITGIQAETMMFMPVVFTGNAASYTWEQSLKSPVNGTVVAARGDVVDSEGANRVATNADAAGNFIVIEFQGGLFVFLAHLRQGTLRVGEGDRVREGDPLGLVGNSGNTTMPHLHVQVQTHANLWDRENRSVPFAFGPQSRVPARNDRVGAPIP